MAQIYPLGLGLESNLCTTKGLQTSFWCLDGLASSHFFRTSSQCGAAQGKEPVKTGKRWTQPQHLRKVSLCFFDFKTASNPMCQFQKEKHTRWKSVLEFMFLSGWEFVAVRHFLHTRVPTNSEEWGSNKWSAMSSKHVQTSNCHTKTRIGHEQCFPSGLCFPQHFKKLPLCLLAHTSCSIRMTTYWGYDTVSAVKVGEKIRPGTRTLSIFTFGSRCARWPNSQFSPCRQLP